jgi:hypothetical protein
MALPFVRKQGFFGQFNYPSWVPSFRSGNAMSCKAIVSVYVRLRNQQALEDMRDLRRELLQSIQHRTRSRARAAACPAGSLPSAF